MKNTPQALRQAGVWLDQRAAVIITRDADDGEFVIQERLQAGGEQRGGSEHTVHSGKQADTLKYFKALAALLAGYDGILVFGPGTLQEQFRNFLAEDTHFAHAKITLETAEHQTDPQMIAQVRNFFT
ncbi:MAG: hypothetical protein JWM59_896 [Verrucomicrobiales bacterium]|nr:hypothetical protein [Verrucomicrobiales bacterium]